MYIVGLHNLQNGSYRAVYCSIYILYDMYPYIVGLHNLQNGSYRTITCRKMTKRQIKIWSFTLQYPNNIQRLFRDTNSANLLLEDYYNPLNYPKLPYDRITCERLCVSLYWIFKCNCFMYEEAIKYAGKPKANGTEIPLCDLYGEDENNDNCSASNAMFNTPAGDIAACGCYEKCDSYRFRVAGQQIIKYNIGKFSRIQNYQI